MSDCERCAKVHEEHNHDALSLPISKIRDGWLLTNGNLYLLIDTGDGRSQAIQLPRYRTDGTRKR
jgi:hypothetical protein